jgi:hypothetical protein
VAREEDQGKALVSLLIFSTYKEIALWLKTAYHAFPPTQLVQLRLHGTGDVLGYY